MVKEVIDRFIHQDIKTPENIELNKKKLHSHVPGYQSNTYLLAISLTTALLRFEGQFRLQLKAPMEVVHQMVPPTIKTYLKCCTTSPLSSVEGNVEISTEELMNL